MGKEKIIAFMDTETTGLVEAWGTSLNLQPHLIEICIILTDEKLNMLAELDTLIKPPIEIPKHITKITNITNEMVETAPNIKKVLPNIKKRLKQSDQLVAQNLRFDYDMIRIEAERQKLKIKFPNELFCTVEQSLHFAGMRLNSKELLARARKESKATEFKNIHRAKADVLAMIEYYRLIAKPFIPKHLRKGN